MSMEELVDFLQDKGEKRFENPEDVAKYLQKLARSSYRLNKAMQDPVNLSLSVTLGTIQHMESQVKRLDKEIAKLMKGITQTLTSVKGIGDVFAAGLIAEIGDIKRFKDHHVLAKYAGLVWSQNQSGNTSPKKRIGCGQGISICDIIWFKQLTRFANMTLNKKPFIQKSFKKFISINTNALSS